MVPAAPPDPLSHLALLRAADLARLGLYDQAEAHLVAAGAVDSAPELDLLARIRSQQGRFNEASALWGRACQAAGSSDLFRANLERVTRGRRLSVGWVALPALALLLMGGAFALGLALGNWPSSADPLASAQLATAPALAVPASEALAGRSGDVSAAPAFSPNVPGTTVSLHGGAAVVSFDAAVFYRGTRLKPSARTVLAAMARQITAATPSVRVNVVGFTDDVPVSRGSIHKSNVDLGLARATVVFRELVRAGVDPRSIAVQTQAEQGALVRPPSRPVDRRTVELHVTRRP